MDESQDLAAHFASVGHALSRFIAERATARSAHETAVVVTGLGAVSPFGAGVKAFWEGISAGACAIRPITLIDDRRLPIPDRRRGAAETVSRIVRRRSRRPAGARRRPRGDRRCRARRGGAARRRAHRRRRSVAACSERKRGTGRAGAAARAEPPVPLARSFPSSHADVLASAPGARAARARRSSTACSSGGASLAAAAELIADGVVHARARRRRRTH